MDNDCGDFSDEDNCESEPRSPCRNHDIDVSEVGRTAGQGYVMKGKIKKNVFDIVKSLGLSPKPTENAGTLAFPKEESCFHLYSEMQHNFQKKHLTTFDIVYLGRINIYPDSEY